MNQPVPLVPSPVISASPAIQKLSSSDTMVAETSTYVDSLINPTVHITEITTAKTVAQVTKMASPRVSHHNPRTPLLAETTGGSGLPFSSSDGPLSESLGEGPLSDRRLFSASILANSSSCFASAISCSLSILSASALFRASSTSSLEVGGSSLLSSSHHLSVMILP